MAHHLTRVFVFFCAVRLLLGQASEAVLPEIAMPKNHRADQWVPAVAVWWPKDMPGGRDLSRVLAADGFAVVILDSGIEPAELGQTFRRLRQKVRIAQGGLHGVIATPSAKALVGLLAHRHEFQTVIVCGSTKPEKMASVKRLHTRRVRSMDVAAPLEIRDQLRAWHRERQVTGVAGEVSQTLDSFHDAAAVADEDRYFAILPDDAVFLGTDATERWTGEEFRAFAMRYFERETAWTYIPLRRYVTLSEDGKIAWFDEVLDNASYGECRGSGVLSKRNGSWVLLQYNLTVPVPNDLMGRVAKQIRAHLDGAEDK